MSREGLGSKNGWALGQMFLCAEFLVPTHQGRRLPGSPAGGLQREQEGRGAHSLALQVAEGRDVSCPEKPGAGGTIRCPEKRVQSGILTRAGLVGGSELWLPGGPAQAKRVAGGSRAGGLPLQPASPAPQ